MFFSIIQFVAAYKLLIFSPLMCSYLYHSDSNSQWNVDVAWILYSEQSVIWLINVR